MSTIATTHHVHYVTEAGATASEQFGTSSEAWAFMRETQRQGVAAGFPVPSSWTCTACK